MEPLAVSIRDAKRATGLGETKIFELIKDGTLETRKVGRRRLVMVSSIRKLFGEAA